VCRIGAIALVLSVFSLTDSLLAQSNEDYDVILVKELIRGPEDTLFMERIEEKVEQWVRTVGRVLVRYQQELPNDRQKRANYFKGHGKLKIHARIAKNSNAAAVTFRIGQTDAAAEAGGSPALDEFRYSKALEPTLTKAEVSVESVLKTVVTPMLRVYMRATRGTQVLADCIRPEVHNTTMASASKRITRLYAVHMQTQQALADMSIHGLNRDQVRHICLHADDDDTPERLSENPSVRQFFDQVVYGDLETGAGRVYLTVERRNARTRTEEQRTIRIPQTDWDSKAGELAIQVLQLISRP
jgi:hypothetical protein